LQLPCDISCSGYSSIFFNPLMASGHFRTPAMAKMCVFPAQGRNCFASTTPDAGLGDSKKLKIFKPLAEDAPS
jgi:hypothetical protein